MATSLQDSFGAVYALLERPRIARRAVMVLLIIHSILLGYSAYVHSPTLNEPGHLVAGLSHWKFGRFDVYNVNPPLVKMVAALPVMAAGYEEDWSGFYEGPGARPEFSMGEDFVAANGERSFFLFMIARWACIPFSWIGAIVCYLWTRDLYGRPAGITAAAIWCFEPNILAHASLMTPDAHATALGLATCYTFWRWLKNPTWCQAVLTGVVLGLAELAKTTLILFYPIWPLMWVIYHWSDRRRMFVRDWLREAGMLVLRMAIGLYVLNVGYGFEGSFTPLKEFHFVSNLFTGRAAEATENPQSEFRDPQSPINRFANTWLGELPTPFPKNYVLGIDVQQRDFEDYGRPSYLRGEWRENGWWYYYLYACAIKVPLALWTLAVVVFVSRFASTWRKSASPRPDEDFRARQPIWPMTNQRSVIAWRDEFILLFPASVIFVAVSSKTGFSEHTRYVLPAFPYFFIFAAHAARLFSSMSGRFAARWLTTLSPIVYKTRSPDGAVSPAKWERRMTLLQANLVAVLGSWLIASSLYVYPHSLSYFNESIGGPRNGPKHLLGSNVDWGQDLLYVNAVAQRSYGPIALAYFGPTNPAVLRPLKSSGPVRTVVSLSVRKSLIEPAEVNEGLLLISVSLAHGWPDFARCGARPKYRLSKALLHDVLAVTRYRMLCYSIYTSDLSAGSR